MDAKMALSATYLASFFMILFGCSTPSADRAGRWAAEAAAQLQVGMNKEEVIERLGRDYTRSSFEVPRDYKFFFVQSDVVPYDLAKRVTANMEIWIYPYWFNSNTQVGLNLFFDDKDRLVGWSKPHSKLSGDKFEHERITSQLRYEMSESAVLKRLGRPTHVTKPPTVRAPELYVDHFWFTDPTNHFREMWVYTYPLENGKQRKVYLLWGKTKLYGWGYDHAHEEAERYLREKSARR